MSGEETLESQKFLPFGVLENEVADILPPDILKVVTVHLSVMRCMYF